MSDTRTLITAFLSGLAAASGNALSGGEVHNSVASKFTTPGYGVIVATINGHYGPNPGQTKMVIVNGRFKLICFALVDRADLTDVADPAEKAEQIANDVALAICNDYQLGNRFEECFIAQDPKAIEEGYSDTHNGQKYMAAMLMFDFSSVRT